MTTTTSSILTTLLLFAGSCTVRSGLNETEGQDSVHPPTEAPGPRAEEEVDGHLDRILEHILSTRDAIEAASDRPPVFMTVWDFDGTILKGDCTEGFEVEGQVVYDGLARAAIEAGLSSRYASGEYERFLADYEEMIRAEGGAVAYPYVVTMLEGALADEVRSLSERSFEILSGYFFALSMQLVDALRRAGVEVFVISASPDLFVKGAAEVMGLPEENILGIRSEFRDGRITDRVVEPVTYGRGKVDALLAIISDLREREPDREVHVLAGFGNSYGNDGPFLAWIAGRELPQGRPLSVMINGGDEPDEYSGVFARVLQEKTFR